MKKNILFIIDLFFLTRPVVIAPVWGFCAFGMYRFSGKLINSPGVTCYLLILLYSMSVGAVYVINQIADYEVDKSNAGFPLLVRGNISIRAAWVCAGLCGLASIVGPLVLGNPSIAFLSVIAIIAGCIYSFKPFSLSGRPFFDFLTNAFEAFLAFAVGWRVLGGSLSDPLLYKFAAPYFLLMCAGSVGSTLPDITGDRAHGKTTTAVRFGARGANLIALAALLITVPVSILLSSDYLALCCAAMAAPFYIIYMARPNAVTMELTYKAGGALTMFAAAFAAPLILPAGLFIFFITWLYFRKRFNIAYPSLTPSAAK